MTRWWVREILVGALYGALIGAALGIIIGVTVAYRVNDIVAPAIIEANELLDEIKRDMNQ